MKAEQQQDINLTSKSWSFVMWFVTSVFYATFLPFLLFSFIGWLTVILGTDAEAYHSFFVAIGTAESLDGWQASANTFNGIYIFLAICILVYRVNSTEYIQSAWDLLDAYVQVKSQDITSSLSKFLHIKKGYIVFVFMTLFLVLFAYGMSFLPDTGENKPLPLFKEPRSIKHSNAAIDTNMETRSGKAKIESLGDGVFKVTFVKEKTNEIH
jgi:hypothetical protein